MNETITGQVDGEKQPSINAYASEVLADIRRLLTLSLEGASEVQVGTTSRALLRSLEQFIETISTSSPNVALRVVELAAAIAEDSENRVQRLARAASEESGVILPEVESQVLHEVITLSALRDAIEAITVTRVTNANGVIYPFIRHCGFSMCNSDGAASVYKEATAVKVNPDLAKLVIDNDSDNFNRLVLEMIKDKRAQLGETRIAYMFTALRKIYLDSLK